MQIDYKLILIVALAALLFMWYRKDHTDTDALTDQIAQNDMHIDSLKTVLSSFEIEQRVTNAQIKTLNDSIEYLNQLLASNDLQIKELKRKRNEKINSVSKYASNDILQFLTNRYNSKYYSTDSTSTPKDSISK